MRAGPRRASRTRSCASGAPSRYPPFTHLLLALVRATRIAAKAEAAARSGGRGARGVAVAASVRLLGPGAGAARAAQGAVAVPPPREGRPARGDRRGGAAPRRPCRSRRGSTSTRRASSERSGAAPRSATVRAMASRRRFRRAARADPDAARRARGLSRQPREAARRPEARREAARSSPPRSTANLTPWQKTLVARHPLRPFTLDYVRVLIRDFVELHGDRAFADDPAIVAGFGFFGDRPVAVVGHQKGRDTKEKIRRNFGMPRPEGYRKALARHEARREVPPAGPHVRRHARAPIPGSTARSAASPRRSREPPRDVAPRGRRSSPS